MFRYLISSKRLVTIVIFSLLCTQPVFSHITIDEQEWSEHIRELNSIILYQQVYPNSALLNKALSFAKDAMAFNILAVEVRRFAYDLSIIATAEKSVKAKYPKTIKAFESFTGFMLPEKASVLQQVIRVDVTIIARAIICKMLKVPLSLDRLTGPGLWVLEEKDAKVEPPDARFAPRQKTLSALTDSECAEIVKALSKAQELNKQGKVEQAIESLKKPFAKILGKDPAAAEVIKWNQ